MRFSNMLVPPLAHILGTLVFIGSDGGPLPTFNAFTVVTVYNTVSNTSRTTTIFNDNPPVNATMPDVNSDGTRIETVTYTRFGTASTTVVTYPTPFFDWPDWYGVGGAYTMTRTAGSITSTECFIGDPLTGWRDEITHAATPMYLTGNPQPTDAEFYAGHWRYNLTKDPYGLNFVWLQDYGSELLPLKTYQKLYKPDEYQHPFNICDVPGIGPHLGMFLSHTDWFIGTATSTSFEGDAEAETTSSEGTTCSIEVPPLSSTTSSEGDDETTVSTQGPIGSTATSTGPPPPTSLPQDESSSTSSQTQNPGVSQPPETSSSSGQDPGPAPAPGISTGATAPVTTVVSTADDGSEVTLTVPFTSASLTTIISTADDGALVTLTVPASSLSLTTVVSTADDGALVTLTVPVLDGTQTSVSLSAFVTTADDGAVVTLYIPIPPTGDGGVSVETGGSEALPSHPVAAGRSITDQRGLAVLFSVGFGAIFGVWYM